MDDESAGLNGIGAFARKTGLSASALRFYADCEILRPATVDDSTGYRFYRDNQVDRAVLLRRLRAAGLPLAEVKMVLDGAGAERERILRDHVAVTMRRADLAKEAIEAVLADLAGVNGSLARVGGAEFASAIRQVVPSAATGGEHPELRSVLIEIAGGAVRFVATDRYRLSLRELSPLAPAQGEGRALADADQVVHIGRWAATEDAVTIELTSDGGCLRGRHGVRALPEITGDFPDYRAILAGLGRTTHRVIADRSVLGDLLTAHGGGAVVIGLGQGELAIAGAGSMPATVSGPGFRIGFDTARLTAALEVSVGPEVLLEITAPEQPVLVRSADQGSFSTLVMPVALN